MASRTSRVRHSKRRYLTDDENTAIPKQSRKRWRDTELHQFDDGQYNTNTADTDFVGQRNDSVDAATTTTQHDYASALDQNLATTSRETDADIDVVDQDITSYDEFYFNHDRDSNLTNDVDYGSDDEYEISSPNEMGCDNSTLEENNPNIPNGDEFIHGLDLTKGQAIVTILSFILRHHLTGAAVEDLLNILDLFVPGCLPPSKFLLTKGLSLQANNFDAHLFCPVCDLYLDKFSESENLDSCTACNTELDREQCLRNGNFYLYIPIEHQLKELLKRHSIIKKSDFVNQEDLTCTFSGRIIKEHYHKGDLSDDDITLMWNCDGAPVFHSSKRSVWPLQAFVNEISPNSKDNCLLIGLWFAKEKPWSHCFLKPFVNEMKRLGTIGMDWLNGNNKIVHSRVFSMCSSCDSCALPMFRNTMQFNGKFGCDWCLQEGEIIERGEGSSRVYTLSGTAQKKRDHIQFMEDALSSSESNPVNGVKGISPLLFLPLFNIVRGFVPDYLHCVLLGVVRTFTGLWLDSKNHDQTWYIGRSLSELNHKLVKMKIPSSISRLPRSLSERKGSEWKSFLLFYSLIILQGTLPQRFLNHWFLLVFSINLLLQDKINLVDVDLAEKALLCFAREVPVLYGKEYCTFNVHQLLHITDAVRDWGPLWGFSCFRFESNIGQILSLVRGTKCVPMQICKTFLMRATLPGLHTKYFACCEMRLDSVVNRLMCSGTYVRKRSISVDGVHLYGSPKTRYLETTEMLAFRRLFGYDPNVICSFRIYDRFAVNSLYLCSIDYKTSNRNLDDTVQLTNQSFYLLLRCVVGKFFCNCICSDTCECEEKVLIFVNHVQKVNERPISSNRELNISSNQFILFGQRNHETICCTPSDIYRKCFRHKLNDRHLIIPLPTINELDK